MFVYIFIIIILLISIIKFDINGQVYGKKIILVFITVYLILLSGLRFRVGFDTMRYMDYYETIPNLYNFQFFDLFLKHHEPFYYLLEVLCRTISSDFVVLQLTQAIFVNVVVVRFFSKYSKYIFTSLLLYFIILYISFNFEIMRQALAVSFFLIAYNYLESNKLAKYFIFSFIASMFHISAIILFIVPFFKKLKINKSSLVLIFFSIMIAYIIGDNIDILFQNIAVTDRLSKKTELYSNTQRIGQTFSLFGVISQLIVSIIIPILFVLFQRKKGSPRVRFENYILIYGIISILTLQVQLFYRFLDYFTPFIVIVLSNFFINKVVKFQKNILVNITCLGLIVMYLTLKMYGQYFGEMSGISNIYRYVPYSSVLTRDYSIEREKMFSSDND